MNTVDQKQSQGLTVRIFVQFFIQTSTIVPLWFASTEGAFWEFAPYKWQAGERKDEDI